ncbi:MAG: hypothetical protein K2N72_12690 [Oscillospiraceae bacterium]|nr:hypothetical protein [Oscillospiraceae bacterium]
MAIGGFSLKHGHFALEGKIFDRQFLNNDTLIGYYYLKAFPKTIRPKRNESSTAKYCRLPVAKAKGESK